jgi:hypothetical protein
LITDKGLECHACFKLWREHKKPPICKTRHGCPVETDAKNTLLNIRVNAFRKYKTLQAVNAPQAMQEAQLERSGMLEDVDALLLCETVYMKYQNLQREQARVKAKHHGR